MESTTRQRSTSRPRPSSRPTTPLRPSSRTSLRDSHGFTNSKRGSAAMQPAINALEPQFAELADSMADLEANFMHLQLMHESLSRFNESFASFLYGLNMNAFCVDFPESPIPESFRRAKEKEAELAREAERQQQEEQHHNHHHQYGQRQHPTEFDGETTFMTTDTSFVDHPQTASKPSSLAYSTPSASNRSGTARTTRGSIPGRYSTRGTATGRRRATGTVRSRGRGVR